MPTLNNASTCGPVDPYLPPEFQTLHLQGVVTGHPLLADGKHIVTSRIVRSEGRRVWTKSGTEYVLETYDPRWVAWMDENEIPFDPEAPVRVRES